MKIVFLDIDGVLIPQHRKKYTAGKQERDEFGLLFDGFCVDNLEVLCREFDAKVVISSTWRLDRMPDWTPEKGLAQMRRLFRHRCIDVDIIGVTPDIASLINAGPLAGLLWEAAERGHEIQDWLNGHGEVSGYVILDDHSDMLSTQKPHFVLCKASEGFNWENCKEAMACLELPINQIA